MLWWSDGRWWLGKLADLGQNRGWIKVESEAVKAHMIRECKPHSIYTPIFRSREASLLRINYEQGRY